ncbi:TetR/AcrR family transcriptional regulator [Oceanobacillus kimchii]|uniref:TetR family transcriptional regulator n=1 Tax=Oceanobacillus kimchii TaxID=746691 RepID=A0ABQ5TEK7_9BACI|nr:TetR/AcrR family transcriptional regulator [Oceanobacillus kimchii]GLO64447.1 TetR family transcriptional regulator [Oceanobacillus kimchii]
MDTKQYLIADARKEQIIKAAIEVLTEIGYIKTSLSKIAKKAQISTGLISYHFSGKDDLMNNTLAFLVQEERAFIKDKVDNKQTYMEKLLAFIEASLVHQVIYRANTTALLEIVFNARTPDNIPYYLVKTDADDELHELLKEILHKGQELKEFGDFDSQVMATMIRGSISGSVSLPQYEIELDLEDYSEKVMENILKMVK